MRKFTAFIDGLADETKTLAKAELKQLVATANKDESDFLRLQAETSSSGPSCSPTANSRPRATSGWSGRWM
jgi:hypothetical protein